MLKENVARAAHFVKSNIKALKNQASQHLETSWPFIRIITPFIFLFLVFSLSTCGYKTVSAFSGKVKTVDTLVVMPPVLNLHSMGAETGKATYDTVLMNRIDRTITSTYQALLAKKYLIHTVEHTNTKPDEKTLALLAPLIKSMEKSKKRLKDIQVDPQLYNNYPVHASRYLLFTYMEGGYRTKAGVKRNQSVTIPLTVAASLFMGSPTIIAGRDSNCRLFQYLYDRQENKVLLYYGSDKCVDNLWQKETTEHLARTASRKLYYK